MTDIMNVFKTRNQGERQDVITYRELHKIITSLLPCQFSSTELCDMLREHLNLLQQKPKAGLRKMNKTDQTVTKVSALTAVRVKSIFSCSTCSASVVQ